MNADDQAQKQSTIRLVDKVAERLIGIETRIATGELFQDYFDIAERTLGKTVEQGPLFAYLFRRFGNPNRGSDPDKDLASYLLTTTMPGMLLRIKPYAGGNTSISFSFLVPMRLHHDCRRWPTRVRDAHEAAFLDWIEKEGRVPEWAEGMARLMRDEGWPMLGDGWRGMMMGIPMLAYGGATRGDLSEEQRTAIDWYQTVKADYEALFPVPDIEWRSANIDEWDEADPMKAVALAMQATLRDLERPVSIRDVAINLRGHLADENIDEDEEFAEYSDAAGYPCGALGNCDPQGFAELHSAVLALACDPVEAIAMATKMLKPKAE